MYAMETHPVIRWSQGVNEKSESMVTIFTLYTIVGPIKHGESMHPEQSTRSPAFLRRCFSGYRGHRYTTFARPGQPGRAERMRGNHSRYGGDIP
jgi:hypothetical protein